VQLGAGRLQQWPHGRSATGQDDVGPECDQFSGKSDELASPHFLAPEALDSIVLTQAHPLEGV
jgi:hypothetical protein